MRSSGRQSLVVLGATHDNRPSNAREKADYEPAQEDLGRDGQQVAYLLAHCTPLITRQPSSQRRQPTGMNKRMQLPELTVNVAQSGRGSGAHRGPAALTWVFRMTSTLANRASLTSALLRASALRGSLSMRLHSRVQRLQKLWRGGHQTAIRLGLRFRPHHTAERHPYVFAIRVLDHIADTLSPHANAWTAGAGPAVADGHNSRLPAI